MAQGRLGGYLTWVLLINGRKAVNKKPLYGEHHTILKKYTPMKSSLGGKTAKLSSDTNFGPQFSKPQTKHSLGRKHKIKYLYCFYFKFEIRIHYVPMSRR